MYARVHECMCVCVSSLVCHLFVLNSCVLPHTLYLQKAFFYVMREGDIRFPPALSLLTRVWVGVTEVPHGVARRSSQSVRGVAEGLRARSLDWLLSALFPGCEL